MVGLLVFLCVFFFFLLRTIHFGQTTGVKVTGVEKPPPPPSLAPGRDIGGAVSQGPQRMLSSSSKGWLFFLPPPSLTAPLAVQAWAASRHGLGPEPHLVASQPHPLLSISNGGEETE